MLRPDFSLSQTALTRAEEGQDEPCLWWLQPHVEWTDDTNDSAQGGSLVHEALAALVQGRPVPALDNPVLRAMYAHAKAWLEESELLGLAEIRAEVVFLFDTETGEAREVADPPGETNRRWYADEELRAKYGVRPSETGTRIDLVVFWGGSVAIVLDYKCHFSQRFVSARAQLEMCSVCVARAWGIERVQPIGLHLWEDMDPQTEELGTLGPSDELELDALALDSIAGDFLATVRRVENAVANDPAALTPKPGPQCERRHCKACAGCPVTAQVVDAALALVPPEQLVRRAEYAWNAPLRTNAQAAWKVRAKYHLKKALEALQDELEAFADASNGVHLETGEIWSGVDQHPESPDLSAPGAIEALQELDLDFAIRTVTTWTEIKRVGGTEKEAQARKVLRAIEGGLKVGQRRVYDARAPKAAAKRAS